MAKIKVLHYMPTFVDCSIYRIARNIVVHLGHEEFEWHISAPNHVQEGMDDFRSVGAEVVHFAPEGRDGTRGALWQTSRNLRAYVQQHDIDIVHTHSGTTTITAWLATRDRKPMRHVYTKHLLTYPKDRKLGWVFTLVNRASLYMVDHIIPVSKTMQKVIVSHVGLNDQKSQPIQNAIDTEYFHAPEERAAARAEFNLQPEHVLIGFTGRLELMKRLDIMLQSFAEVNRQVPETRLLIVGVGSLDATLKAQAKSLGIEDQVIWAGWRSDVPRILAAIDIYAQSSVNEGLSLSILEAMAASKTIVSTEVGGIREIIQSPDTGTIVPPENVQALAEGILKYAKDRDLLVQTGKNAREFIIANFGIERMTSLYGEMYRREYARLKR